MKAGSSIVNSTSVGAYDGSASEFRRFLPPTQANDRRLIVAQKLDYSSTKGVRSSQDGLDCGLILVERTGYRHLHSIALAAIGSSLHQGMPFFLVVRVNLKSRIGKRCCSLVLAASREILS